MGLWAQTQFSFPTLIPRVSKSSPKSTKIAEWSLRWLERSGWPLKGSNWPETWCKLEKNPKTNDIFWFFARKVFNSALYLGGPYDFAAYEQKSWIMNGLCNIAFAHPACCFDGGDCGCTTCLHVSYQIQAAQAHSPRVQGTLEIHKSSLEVSRT